MSPVKCQKKSRKSRLNLLSTDLKEENTSNSVSCTNINSIS